MSFCIFFYYGRVISCLDTLLVSYGCCNKLPQTGCLKTIEMYPLMVLESRSLKSRSQQDYTTSRGSGDNSTLPLPASGESRNSLVSLDLLLQFLFPWSHFLFLFLCLHLLISLLMILVIEIRAHLGNPWWSHLKVLNYVCTDSFSK